MGKEMTARERGLAVFKGEVPDRAPVCNFGNAAMLGYTGHTIGECRGNTALTDEIMKKWVEDTGADFFFGPFETKGIFMDLPDIQIKLPDDDQGSLQNNYLASSEDVRNKPLYDPMDPEKCPNFHKYVVDFFAAERKACPDVMTPVWCEGVLTTSGFLRGIEDLILMMLTDSAEAKKVIARGAKFSRDIVSAQLEEIDADYVVYTDPVSSADMIDGEMFKEFNLEHLHNNITYWQKKYGIGTMLHICGDTTPMLPNFAKTGARAMSLDHAVDLKVAKAEFGDKLAVMGNIDPVSILLNGTAGDVEMAAEKCFSDAGEGGGYIFGAGCAEPKGTPLENIRRMVEVSKRHPY